MADYSFAQLQVELTRINLLIQRAVRLAQLAGQSPDDALRGLYVPEDKAAALAARPPATGWQHQAELPAEEQAAFDAAMQQVRRRLRSIEQQARRAGAALRLDDLCRTFGLNAFDRSALLVCLAPALDLRFEQLYGYLQDDVTRKQASPSLILDLLCPPGPQRLQRLWHFADAAPLVRCRLIERTPDPQGERSHLLNQLWRPAPIVVSWLIGHSPDVLPISHGARWVMPGEEHLADACALLPAQVQAALAHAAASAEVPPPAVVVWGDDALTRTAVAFFLACQLKRPLLLANAAALSPEDRPLNALAEWQRDARLLQAVLCIQGWTAWAAEADMPQPLAAALLSHPGWLVIEGNARWPAHPAEARGVSRRIVRIGCSTPPYEHRRQLWQHHLQRAGVPLAEDPDDAALAGAFAMTAGQIRDAVAVARDEAMQQAGLVDNALLFAVARAQTSPALGNLARKITPRYAWADLVLPDDQLALLRELVATVRSRPLVLEEWGVGRKLAASEGVTALFAGPPGTGKTMAAEVIAAELRLDLYKIDLSTIISKYIGETEKNLERIFSEAEHSNAILFFDEADAIFGKRSEVRDAHDRYANIEVSYLLQRMEGYNGVTILATNLRANLDEAFIRRLQFAVDFPFPDEAYRLRIWQTLFPPQTPRDDSVDFAWLARRLKLAGGNIRNIIVGAAFLAASNGGKVSMAHLLHSARRELQKMGRLVNEKDLAWEP